MEITSIRIFLREPSSNSKLKAYGTITIDDAFVVRRLKVIEGSKGLFVAMPSEKMKEACPTCGHRNVVRSRFCNQCGSSLPEQAPASAPPAHPPAGAEGEESSEGGRSEHRDVAHPITAACREVIQKKVLEAFEAARSQSGLSHYPPA